LHWKKGIEFALFALHLLSKKGILFTYTICGSGPEKEKLLFLIDRLGLTGYIKLMDFIKHSEVPTLLDNADILLIPSLQEGCSNIALEAQSRGCYCIGFDSEGMKEIIQEDITGNVVEIGDWRMFANSIEKYSLLGLEERNSKSSFAIQHVKMHFARSEQIRKWVHFFSSPY
jgi:glycosyltransferase involved in cell wall biosynthesis